MGKWLVLDVGNTHTVAGLVSESGEFGPRVRFRTDASATADEYRTQIYQIFRSSSTGIELDLGVERLIVSTVVPQLERTIKRAFAGTPSLFINSSARCDFELELPHPEQLGADRLANVAGALQLAKSPFVIVDAGTATTFCLVDSRSVYIGGSIVPGLELGWKALQSRAAKLFSVELIRPDQALGNTTESQLTSGVLHGYEALIEGLVDRLLLCAVARGNFNTPTFFATGGVMNLLKLSSRFRVEPDLTLLGVWRYGQLNP